MKAFHVFCIYIICIVYQLNGQVKVKLRSKESLLLYFEPTNKADVNLFWDQ